MYLLTPIKYLKTNKKDPFNNYQVDNNQGNCESIYCFEIDQSQSGAFEPDKNSLPGTLVFAGSAIAGSALIESDLIGSAFKKPETAEPVIELPQGNYLFCQARDIIGREKIIDLMADVQQEGLWQRLVLHNRCYLRFLYEDGSTVTQILRPYSETAAPDQ